MKVAIKKPKVFKYRSFLGSLPWLVHFMICDFRHFKKNLVVYYFSLNKEITFRKLVCMLLHNSSLSTQNWWTMMDLILWISLSLYSAHDETWPHLESDKSPELFTMPTCIYSQSVALRFEWVFNLGEVHKIRGSK